MRAQMSDAQRDEVWSVLRMCGANVSLRDDFDHHFPECVEYRFQGFLGFGGKVYAQSGRMWVGCYPEDRTSTRDRLIKVANERLSAISEAAS